MAVKKTGLINATPTTGNSRQSRAGDRNKPVQAVYYVDNNVAYVGVGNLTGGYKTASDPFKIGDQIPPLTSSKFTLPRTGDYLITWSIDGYMTASTTNTLKELVFKCYINGNTPITPPLIQYKYTTSASSSPTLIPIGLGYTILFPYTFDSGDVLEFYIDVPNNTTLTTLHKTLQIELLR